MLNRYLAEVARPPAAIRLLDLRGNSCKPLKSGTKDGFGCGQDLDRPIRPAWP
jgi:hypothetical protein